MRKRSKVVEVLWTIRGYGVWENGYHVHTFTTRAQARKQLAMMRRRWKNRYVLYRCVPYE